MNNRETNSFQSIFCSVLSFIAYFDDKYISIDIIQRIFTGMLHFICFPKQKQNEQLQMANVDRFRMKTDETASEKPSFYN